MRLPDFDTTYHSRRLVDIANGVNNTPKTNSNGVPTLTRSIPKNNSSSTRGRISRIAQSTLRDKVHLLYDGLMNSGQIVAPEKDIKLGKRREINLSDNGIDKIVLTNEHYNSTLMFTFLSALMDKASVIYFGEPGTGKTTAPEVVINALYGIPLQKIQEATIYGNPELTTSDMVATLDIAKLMKGKEIVIPRKFMTSVIRIIDEVNRISPSKLAILYQLADRGFANFKNKIIRAPPGPLYATANYRDAGNYDIPKPFLDRFDIFLRTTNVNPFYMRVLSEKKQNHSNPLSRSEVESIKKEIRSVSLSEDAMSRLAYFLAELNFCDLAGRDPENKTKSHAKEKKTRSSMHRLWPLQ